MSDPEAAFIGALVSIVLVAVVALIIRSGNADERRVCASAMAGSTVAADTLRVVLANPRCADHIQRKAER